LRWLPLQTLVGERVNSLLESPPLTPVSVPHPSAASNPFDGGDRLASPFASLQAPKASCFSQPDHVPSILITTLPLLVVQSRNTSQPYVVSCSKIFVKNLSPIRGGVGLGADMSLTGFHSLWEKISHKTYWPSPTKSVT
jgi:hypothetical protein